MTPEFLLMLLALSDCDTNDQTAKAALNAGAELAMTVLEITNDRCDAALVFEVALQLTKVSWDAPDGVLSPELRAQYDRILTILTHVIANGKAGALAEIANGPATERMSASTDEEPTVPGITINARGGQA